LALGREPLSLRMLATAALFVMVLWPEAVVGPSFQMSFAAVIAIIALHGSAPVRAFLAPREEGWPMRQLRNLVMLIATGVVIELALMPIGLFHFHRAGVYGALANVIAIPLTTFISMPLIGLALTLDLVGAGGPVWWLAGWSIEIMLILAHWTAAQPGAVTMMPAMGKGSIALFAIGGLWLALWRGRVRLWGLAPVLIGAASLLALRPPDILVSGDGKHVGITGQAEGQLLVLREGRSDFARDNLLETAGMSGTTRLVADWPGAHCGPDFCVLELRRDGTTWRLLLSRGQDRVEERNLAAACERVDIVIADRWLPRSCHPAMLKVDRGLLSRTGGMTIDLENRRIQTVAEGQGEHGWWHLPEPPRRRPMSGQPAGDSDMANSRAASDKLRVSGDGRSYPAPAQPEPVEGRVKP
jgi:competence protein ComEC